MWPSHLGLMGHILFAAFVGLKVRAEAVVAGRGHSSTWVVYGRGEIAYRDRDSIV